MEELAVKKQMSLQECLDDLEDEIIFGKNKDHFLVFPIETAGGKTYTTTKAIRGSYKSLIQDNKRYIFVTKFKDEAIRVANDINEEFENNIAMVYTPDATYKKNKCCSTNFFECAKVNTLIITHSMYCKLCNPKKKQHEDYRDIFKTYKTLIVDEEINFIKDSFFEFTEDETYWIKTLDKLSKHDLSNKFRQLIQPLIDLIEQDYRVKNQLHRVECDYSRTEIEELHEELFENVKKINRENFEMIEEERCSRENLLELLDNILMLYDCIDNNIALIYPNKSIYGYDYSFKYLLLDNNIWLDASASFNTMYQNELFKVAECQREIDHSECEFIYHDLNTSTTSKNNNDNFRKDISKYLKKNYSDTQTLILTKKAECKQLKKVYLKEFNNFEYLNFENMRGVDKYKEYEVCAYIHTYRLTRAYYIFCYEYFNNTCLRDKELIVSTKQIKFKDGSYKTEWGFEKQELYKLMITDMASSMYQGLKRIQRNRNPKGKFEVFTSSHETLCIVVDQLKGIDEKNIINPDIKKEKLTDRMKLLNYIDNKLETEEKWTRVQSNEVIEKLEISKSNWSKIWKNEDFIKDIKTRRIKQSQLKIDGSKNNWIIKY